MRLSSVRSLCRTGALAAGLAFLGGLPGTAVAQMDSREGIALQNQIYELRQEIQALQDQPGRGAQGGASNLGRAPSTTTYQAPPHQGSDLLAQLLTRVDSLDDQLRQLRGRIDETQNQMERQNADLGKRIDDLAFQLNPQGAPGAAPAAQPPAQLPGQPLQQLALPGQPIKPTVTPPAPPGPPLRRTPEMAMQEGNAALARRDYAAAEVAAREVAANRTSPRAYDAQLLLAQALSGQRQYAQAAIAYDDAYRRSTRGAHAQDALVGLANALAAINEKKAACDTLAKLRSEFNQPRSDLRDQILATQQRAGCK